MDLQWPHRLSLMPPSPTCSAQVWMIPIPSHLVSWMPHRDVLCLEAPCIQLQGPCTHKVGSWSHHLVDDAEDPANDVEDTGDGVEALVDDGEALYGLEMH